MNLFGYGLPVLIVLGILGGAWAMFANHYEKKGVVKTEKRYEKAHTKTVAEARQDEKVIADTGTKIGTNTGVKINEINNFSQKTTEDINHEFTKTPVGSVSTPVAFDSSAVRSSINAVVDRANRAADSADARP